MPVPSTGSIENGDTLLSAFGQPVTLEDGSTIQAIFKRRDDVFVDESEADQRESFRLHFPANQIGTLAAEQEVVIEGDTYFVATINYDSDGWARGYMRPQPREFTPIPTPGTSGFGPGFGKGVG